MATQQPDLFPVSQDSLNHAGFRLDELHEEEEMVKLAFDEAKKDHKQTLERIREQMLECRLVIKRAKAQRQAKAANPAEVIHQVVQATADHINTGAMDSDETTVRAEVR